MTRAKDELHLLLPQRFYTHQQPPAMATATSTPPAPGSSVSIRCRPPSVSWGGAAMMVSI
jgi:hypothetical protein